MTETSIPKIEKPCRVYAKGQSCKDGRDHCFNCGRHLHEDGVTCAKGCGGGDSEKDDVANNDD